MAQDNVAKNAAAAETDKSTADQTTAATAKKSSRKPRKKSSPTSAKKSPRKKPVRKKPVRKKKAEKAQNAKKTKKAADNATKSMTKTAAIRAALAASKTGSPSEVATALKGQGVKVTAAYVSTIKAADKRKAASGGSARGPGRPSAGVARTNRGAVGPVEDLREASELMLLAVDLVVRAGAAEARHLIAMAEQMVDRISD